VAIDMDRSFAALARAVIKQELPPLQYLAMPTATAVVNPVARQISYGLTLNREQHGFLRRFAMERGVPASVVVRRLLTLLQDDAYVSASLSRTGQGGGDEWPSEARQLFWRRRRQPPRIAEG